MGTTSSQPVPPDTQNTIHTPDLSQDTVPQLDGAGMDDPAERDDIIHVKKKRKSADATRPLKRSRMERESEKFEEQRLEIKDSQDATGNGQQATVEEIAQKPRKKRPKKDHAVRNEGESEDASMLATQSSIMHEETPQSTADTFDGEAKKRAKAKRKRPTGRPSGLNILPAGMSDPITQEDSAIVEPARSAVPESPKQLAVGTQVKEKKSKDSKRVSGHLSPEMTNAQSWQPGAQKTKSPKVKKTSANGKSPAVDKSPKASKKREAKVQKEAEMLPTPPEATQASRPKTSKASKQPLHDQGGDEDALRDDYSEVDATGQVEGWLSSQLSKGNSPATPRFDPPGSTLRKKAAANASAKREKAQHTEDPETSKNRRRQSQYLEDDNEDYVPEKKRDAVVTETPASTGRRGKKRANGESGGVIIEAATPDVASPLVSKKARSSRKTEKSARKGTAGEEKQATAPSTPIAGTSTTRKRKQKPTHDDEENEDASDYNGGENATAEKNSATQTNKTRTAWEASSSREKPSHNAQRSAKGPLTSQEKDMVDRLFQETIAETGMSDADLRSMIKNWKTAAEFKDAVETALPDRPLAAIRKFCQRRYHNMERGAWSAEDDASLRSAYAAHPDKWTDISALVGRTASDCKDRWKNTVSIQETMQLGPWSQEETVSLAKAVEQSIKELKKANKDTKGLSRAELERMLSWSEVAKKLGGTRSAKRCNEKWQKMKRANVDGRVSVSAQPLATGLDPKHSSNKLREIEKLYNQCDVGDLYDILTEIHTALPDPNQHFEHESTLWAIVATKNPGSRFKSAMRRRGLHDAAGVYAAEVGDHESVSSKAKTLAEFLESQWGTKALAEKRSFAPKSKAPKFKSAEKVDSDGEDELVDDDEPAEVDTDTPPTSNGEDDDDDNSDDEIDELASENSPDVEVPDSQPMPAAKNEQLDDDFAFAFKPINKKKRKEPSPPQETADSDGVEQLPSSAKRKKSSKKAKSKA